ncbi:hypothetical protein B0J12DRAFT_379692 [Macrophomina phaseolina]|uniref:Uncharacterized protein n=1 Tax=Macrophomina phaseolina TaxID=35725 RepID=A0ABQ8GLG3_9PEZI|nr:hypothetical protein B0J12DRAFT_379692 [Macrophomina phaseolina]
MSSSIAIPKRKKSSAQSNNACSPTSSSSLSSSASARSPVASPSSSASSHHHWRPDRRPSLLSTSISKSEHTVINVGHPDAPRLITCVKASQGFDWNQDIFLPSYADYESTELERRQDPVQDIILTDEEIASMFPSSS